MENLDEVFYGSLVKQIRAIDSYGAYTKYTDEELLSMKYVKRPDTENIKHDQVIQNTKFYLQATCVSLEKLSGHIVCLMTEAGCDGSVQALLYSGQLIVLDKTFGSLNNFQNIDKLKESGGKLLTRLINIMNSKSEKFSELMG